MLRQTNNLINIIIYNGTMILLYTINLVFTNNLEQMCAKQQPE